MPQVGIRIHSEDWLPNFSLMRKYFTRGIMTWSYSDAWKGMRKTCLSKKFTKDALKLTPMGIQWKIKFSKQDITGWLWKLIGSNISRSVTSARSTTDKVHVSPTPLNVLTSPWSFSMWGIDIIGMIDPKASNGHRFILVVIDYFTKWVEVDSYTNVIRQVIARFIKKKISCRYGVPNKIITDNGLNLNNKVMDELYESSKIEHHNSSPYRSKMNDAVEAANKNIKKTI